MVFRRSVASKANLLAIETVLVSRRQQSADHKDKVCQVGVTMNTSSFDRLFEMCTHPQSCPRRVSRNEER